MVGDYQLIKHYRVENVKKDQLKNAVTSVIVFYYFLRHSVTLLSMLEGREYVSEKSYSNFGFLGYELNKLGTSRGSYLAYLYFILNYFLSMRSICYL